MVRFSVVDTHRWHGHIKSNSSDNENVRRRRSTVNSKNDMFDIELDFEIKFRKHSDMTCVSLENG